MNELKKKVIENIENKAILTFFYADLDENNFELKNVAELPHYEYHNDLHQFSIPDSTKFILNNRTVLLNPESGIIFAYEWGRYVFAIRFHLSKKEIKSLLNSHKKLLNLIPKIKRHFKAKKTLNYWENFNETEIIDFRKLGENWAVSRYLPNINEQIKVSYNKSK
jgi:hypothetical protein